MLKYVSLALILAYTYLGQEWTATVLAYMTGFYAMIFYGLMFYLITGLKQSTLDPDFDIMTSMTTRLVHIGSVAFLWLAGFQMVAIFALPWIIVMTLAGLLSILVKKEIMEIQKVEPEDTKDE